MSYQEIYRGLNKKASDEQVKKLAAVIGMRKRAWFSPTLRASVKSTINKLPIGDFGKKVLYTSGKALANHPYKTLGTTGATGALLTGVPYAIGSAGKADLKSALDKANATNTKLTEQNKKLRDRGIWDMILQNWDKFSKWFADLFKGEPDKQLTTQGNK